MDSPIAKSESSTLPPNLKWRYDVFLSFRGEDTRSNFTSHLDMALRQKGVNVFIDDKLNRGELISESLFRSIEEASISIVIFSENYASSSWCLDELVKIIECKKSKDQIVCPIFYKVDPSDVRNQTGSFGEALTTHQAKFKTKIQIWKDALTAAANLSGWNLGSRREADLIQNLVEEVLSILNFNSMPLYVAKYPVGIDSQLNFLRLGSPYWTQDEPSIGVYMVGIYGIGGIGKTTLAKALYNKIAHQFEACCFLSKVREASKQFNGLVQLQETLLHEILKEDLKVGNLDKGINILRHRLRSKKVLIALDDVDKLEQLEALVGAHDWFGIGSMIIVTTRNNHLISTHEFDQKHGILVMNDDHALELFSWHAFKKNHPPSNYLDLSKRATSYCNGHPLALVVLGSFLCTRAEQAYWKIILDEFETSLNKDINDILQISFDGLEEKEKEIFLDISCLLVGEKVDYVKNILNACHLNPDFGILVLMDLSLITIENDKVEMHDLIRQMGYKIVNGESSEPGKRSRLWLEEDILKVFIDNSGTDAVKAIKLELPNLTRLDVDPRAFRKMKNLRLLMVQNARFSTNLKYLPDNLKWIKWHAFSQDSLPSSFITKNLVGLDMQHSRIQNFEKGWKDCKRLKLVDFSYSTLEKIPDFSSSSGLEKLYLNHCTNLRAIPMSVVFLSKLVILDLNHCSNLKKLPNYLRLKSLKVLNLNYCKKLEELPNFSAASNLENLYLKECTNLRMIHESIGSLDELVTLDLEKCSNLKKLPGYLSLKSLKHLNLDHCKKLQEIPDFSAALNLQSLYLKKCTNLRVLHESIGSLDNLVVLDVRHCTKLEKLPSYLKLKSLRYLELSGCSKLEMFPKMAENMKSLVLLHLDSTGIKKLPSSIGNLTELKVLNLDGCTNLISVPGIIYLLQNLKELHLGGCSRFEMLPHKWDSPIHPLCSSSNHGNLPTNPMFSQLTLLDLQHCNLSNADFLEILCDVNPFLNSLLLSKNKFCSLPSCLHKFMSLWNLQLRNCKFLRQIPILPQCIQRMDATGCESLVRSPDNVLDIISSKQDITLGDFPREFILMNIEIPEWFSHQTISNSIKVSFRHDHNIERTLATSAKFRVDGDSYEGEALISCNIFIGYRLQSSFMRKFAPSTSEYTWLVTTSSPTFSSSLVANDWNDVIVWFEVVKRREVNVTIRSCGVHLTDEVDGIQNDIKGQGVIYTDYDQSVELGSWDVIKSFTQEVSARSDCNAMLHAQNFPVEIDSKIQPLTNFPLHVTCYGVTRISGMEGMAETTLAKSIFDKLVDNSFGREALNDWGGFIEMNKLGFRGGSRSCNTSNRPSSQKYLRVFDGGYKFAHVNDAVDSDGHLNFTRFLRIDDVKEVICAIGLTWPHMDNIGSETLKPPL